MDFSQSHAQLWSPVADAEQALAGATHLGICAHADDLEILAVHGILECFQQSTESFAGVVVTDGAGSPRRADYADTSDAEMRRIRQWEQRKAAVVGEYAALAWLDHSSSAVKAGSLKVQSDLAIVLNAAQPHTLYTHSLTDHHDTHVAVALRVIAALRQLPVSRRPRQVIGCEVWGDLDWLPPPKRIEMDVSVRPHLQAALLGVFDSQIAGGKRYDSATLGRRQAHATFGRSHAPDARTGLVYGMDLTPLARDASLSPVDFTHQLIDVFASDVNERLSRLA